MANEREIRCPACDGAFIVEIDASSEKIISLPKFCGDCGSEFHRTCPHCKAELRRLSRFCGDCGKQLYANGDGTDNVIETTLVRNGKASEMLDELRATADLGVRLMRELYLVVVRLNPANLAAYRFYESIGAITEETPRNVIADIVGNALHKADLSHAQLALTKTHEAVRMMAAELVRFNFDTLEKYLPNYRKFVAPHSWIERPDESAERVAHHISSAITKYASELPAIEQHYSQLVEHYDRYRGIMTRTGILDYAIGFAAGFFGGGLGMIGAGVWDDWRGKSDQDFLQSYFNAVDQFTKASFGFTQRTEETVTTALNQVLDELKNVMSLVYDGLAKANASGVDISDACMAFLIAPESPDEDSLALYEIVISNLRDAGLTLSEERHVRESLRM